MMLVVRRTAFLLIFGVIAGVACSWMAARAIKSMLFGIGPHDLVTIVAASMLLVTCGLIAAFIPARRAASIDPIQALRTE
jgi:ABC-type antimicrobial peptide transport system permease subunit